jgi:hypothetical protein
MPTTAASTIHIILLTRALLSWLGRPPYADPILKKPIVSITTAAKVAQPERRWYVACVDITPPGSRLTVPTGAERDVASPRITPRG